MHKSALKKEGIEIVKQLDTFKVNLIAQKITNRLCSTFPEYGFSRSDLFASLSRLNMYLAKLKDPLCGAKYYYKDNAIYFNIDFSLLDADVFALHECIHYLQEKKDKKGNLIRLGLYDYLNGHGMAINEAAVQLMTANCLKNQTHEVSYYNLNFPSNSTDCYPLECAIVKQMVYFTGDYPLFYSTIQGNNIFKNTFITLADSKSYSIIESNLDKILELENELSFYFDELKAFEDDILKEKKINQLINTIKNEIMNLFIECQNTIMTTCFKKALNNIRSLNDIKELKNKIYNFQNYIATNNSYTYYNEFYRYIMEELDKKNIYITEHGSYDIPLNTNTGLAIISNVSSILIHFRKILTKLGLLRERSF